ncbi:hypothetical protein B0H11DRAFT_2280762 [Mycena galericulata]|nr:hypothetical protein B0H11DRAFT_2280762 [Mycena galericulata]
MPKRRAQPRAQPIPRIPAATMKTLMAAQEQEMVKYRRTLALVHQREQEKRELEKRERELRDKELPPVPQTPVARPDSSLLGCENLAIELPVTKSPAPVAKSRLKTPPPVAEDRENQATELPVTKSPAPVTNSRAKTPPPVAENRSVGTTKSPSKSPSIPSAHRSPLGVLNGPPSPSIKGSPTPSKWRQRRPWQNMGWLNDQFPSIASRLILKIVRHELSPMELVRLDASRWNDKFEDGCLWTDYLTLEAVVSPLAVYFRVLQTWVAATSRDVDAVNVVGDSALAYAAQLFELNERYNWFAVLQYHMQFHEKQRQYMRRGDYVQWRFADRELIEKLLVRRERPAWKGVGSVEMVV